MPRRRNVKPAPSGKIVVKIATAIIVVALLVILGRYGFKALASNRAQRLYDELFGVYQASVYIEQNAVSSINDPTSSFPSDYLERFRDLYIKNKQIAGWLSIEGTNVHFPIVQGTDNEHYKTRNFVGEMLGFGTPYFDVNTDVKNPEHSANKIIWLDGDLDATITTELRKYLDISYYRNHPIIDLATVYEAGQWKVISAFVTSDDVNAGGFNYYDYHNFLNEEELTFYIDQIRKRSVFDTRVNVAFGDELVTISAPTVDFDGARLVIVARKIRTNETELDEAQTASPNKFALQTDEWYRIFGGERPAAEDMLSAKQVMTVIIDQGGSDSSFMENPPTGSEDPVEDTSSKDTSSETSFEEISSEETSSKESSSETSSEDSSETSSEDSSETSSEESSKTSSETSSKPTSSETSSKPTSSTPTSSNTSSAEVSSRPTSSKPTSSETSSETPSSKPTSSETPSSKPTSSETSSEESSRPTSSENTSSTRPLVPPTSSNNTSSEDVSSSKPTSSEPTSSEPTSSEPTSSEPASSDEPTSSEDTSSEDTSSSGGSTSLGTLANKTLQVYENGVLVTDTAYNIVCQIVANEMNDSCPDEALKAQAVAAHTFVVFHNNMNWIPEVGLRTPSEKIKRLVKEVIEEMVYYNGKPIYAAYFSTSAGYTNTAGEVWGGTNYPYTQMVESKYDYLVPNYKVVKQYTYQYVRDIIREELGISLTGDPTNWFEIVLKTNAGYASLVNVGGQTTYTKSNGSTAKITGTVIRGVFGLRSNHFDIVYKNDAGQVFEITTLGYGHGVGMSQYGAIQYAKIEGWDYKQILNHYYTGVEVY